MKNTLNQKYYLNNPGSGEKEFFKVPDYIEEFILDNRENFVFGETRPCVNFTLVYDKDNLKYHNRQYLALKSFREKHDDLLDQGYAFAGIVNYGDQRTNRIYAYAKFVQLD